MKSFALVMYAFAAICLIAGIGLLIAGNMVPLVAFCLLAAVSFAIPGFIVQKENPEKFKK